MIFLSRCDEINGCGKTYPGDLSHCHWCGNSSAFSSPAPIDVRDYVYDIETYPNTFTCCFIHLNSNTRWRFEISDRINQINEFCEMLIALSNTGARMVGYNSVGFDYPVVHYILENTFVGVAEIYAKAMECINGDSYNNQIWEDQRIIPQVDLMLINHFEYKSSKATSLKALEFAMRMNNIEDLPFPPGTVLNPEQQDFLHVYNEHDCVATAFFYVRNIAQIKLREELTEEFGINFINHNEVKIGKDLLVSELRKGGIECYDYVGKKSVPKQTIRPHLKLSEVVFPYIKFERPEFQYIHNYFLSKTITETKGVFNGLIATVDGVNYKFGTGGLHASIESRVVESTDTHQIVDVDVASFYPNEGIKNGLFPAHLGIEFCGIQLQMYNKRKTYEKSNPRNGAYKLALNGAFGGSNSPYSPFFDSFYTMQITINGQLLLCMLVEQLVKIPGLSMIQANTDGVTFSCPREYLDHQRSLCKWWENLTCLELEEALYSRMFIRDVNNYAAVYESGGVKRIGAYAYETPDSDPTSREITWNKDHSAIVVQKAAMAALLDDVDIREFITNHVDTFDFMLMAKVPRDSQLVMRYIPLDNYEEQIPSIIRYYISTVGGSLYKISPPKGKLGTWKCKNGVKAGDPVHMALLMAQENRTINDKKPIEGVDVDGIFHDERIHTKNGSKYIIRETGISAGVLASDCSDAKHFNRAFIDYEYYINEARKLVDPLR